ncbi:MAG: Ppx/GppA family phosphatase [Acidobacteria bacterium]|nr:Ppx/GppA family phosphatase [Acidobacteriota bacterium]
MKLATVDIGSNSFHLLVVDVDEEGYFRVIDREREMARLGSGGLTVGQMTIEAMDRAIVALGRFAELARSHGCERIIATATSAVREASNGDKFLKRVRRKTGIEVDMLSGVEEARLIARSVSYVRNLGTSATLGIDIGGGSTEFWILAGGEHRVLISNRLGAVRLSDGFIHGDPVSKRELELLRGYIVAALARTKREVAEAGFENVIVTSGTALTLAEMAYALENGDARLDSLPPQDTEGLELTSDALRRLTRTITKSPLRERKKIPGLPEERADIIVAGAVLLDTIFSELQIRSAMSCDWALREGVLIDYLDRHAAIAPNAGASDDSGLELGEIRRRSILALARRCEYDAGHARQTSRLAKSIFDQTSGLHGLGEDARGLLEASSVLHDIGYTIAHAGHNRHGQYLIMNSELVGFSSREQSILGNIVRYHGGRLPKKKHQEFARLRSGDRRLVEKLTAILTVADALDRTNRSAVQDVQVTLGRKNARFTVVPASECTLEVWDASRKASVFERVFGVRTEVELSTTPVRNA